MRGSAVILLSLQSALGCDPEVPASAPASPRASSGADAPAADPPRHKTGEMVAWLQRDAKAMRPLLSAKCAQRFVDATDSLPAITTRTLYQDKKAARFYSSKEAASLA